MALNEDLIYAELLKITKSQGVLEERTECLPALSETVTKLEQQVEDHLTADPERPIRSRGKQTGIIGLALAAVAGVSVAMAELGKLLGR
jgi:hypothetical protein|tara:strand:+ start:1885 stop:2151 length:267 start_codon:yes stop_codon:yes gene_type:complete